MKQKIAYPCCRWFALLLVTTNIVFISPEIAADTSYSQGRKFTTLNTGNILRHISNKFMMASRSSDTTKWFLRDKKSSKRTEISTPALTSESTQHDGTNAAKTVFKEKTIAAPMPQYYLSTAYPKYMTYQNFTSLSFKVAEAHRHRHTRQTEEEPIDKCRLFVEGDPEKNEFYSPDYPNDYPKNINCTRVITAPKGQIIRLDFRNSFHIEAKDECKFDFLEIRDGPYGYSNLIGKYCGTDFPPEITSKERYLWLHFHSDESIEYSGFTAVYEFIDRNRDTPSADLNCTIEKEGFEGFINSTDVPQEIKESVITYKIPLDCVWRIQVQEKWKIQVKFLDFKLSKPNDCETNFLDIFPEQTVMPLRVKNFCGSAGEGITSESNILHMHFYAEQVAINSTFAILYTAFRDRGPSGCTEEEYDCEDATCISNELQCNGRDNCKFRWDEEGCAAESTGQSEHVVIIIIVFGLILGGMVITFLVNCIRKIMHDQKIIREHIRQSKESKLDEIGRRSKARSTENLSSAMLRRKPSQGSLQLLEDPNHYYREVVPVSLEVSKDDLKEKEHSILRHRNDMVVQTSFCSAGDDDSSEATVEAGAKRASTVANACDMGCQTRESLFATAFIQKQSSIASIKDKGSKRSLSRFSTFGYDAPQPPQVSTSTQSHLQGRNVREPQEYVEMKERHPVRQRVFPQITSTEPPTMPQEMCHHHHQHLQHRPEHTHQHVYQQQQALTGTQTNTEGKKVPKISQTTAYIDIRNSAPDVIIMTSQ